MFALKKTLSAIPSKTMKLRSMSTRDNSSRRNNNTLNYFIGGCLIGFGIAYAYDNRSAQSATKKCNDLDDFLYKKFLSVNRTHTNLQKKAIEDHHKYMKEISYMNYDSAPRKMINDYVAKQKKLYEANAHKLSAEDSNAILSEIQMQSKILQDMIYDLNWELYHPMTNFENKQLSMISNNHIELFMLLKKQK